MYSNRLRMFSRDKHKHFIVVWHDRLPPNMTQEQFAQELSQKIGFPVTLMFNPVTITPDKNGRERCVVNRRVDVNNPTFFKFADSNTAAIYVEETPSRVQQAASGAYEIKFSKYSPIAKLVKKNPDFLKKLAIDEFSYTVTRKTLDNRIGMKRPRTQNDVMGQSARDRLISGGASLPGTDKSEAMHWAHRRAFSHGGQQEASNLDLGTSGSNYSTLLWFEAPLKRLMREGDVKEVRVTGKAYMHPSNLIPVQIEYVFKWGNGCTLTGSTYPLETRLPTLAEYHAAATLFKLTRTPPSQTKKNSISTEIDDNQTGFMRQPNFNSM